MTKQGPGCSQTEAHVCPAFPRRTRDGGPTGYPAPSNSGVTRLGGGFVLVPHSRHPGRAAASPSLVPRDETRWHSRRYLRQDELSDELRATLGADPPSPGLQRSSRLDASQAQTGESRVPRLPEAATKGRSRKSPPCPPGALPHAPTKRAHVLQLKIPHAMTIDPTRYN